LARAQKKLSSKQKGSRNREKARKDVARIYQKIVNLLWGREVSDLIFKAGGVK